MARPALEVADIFRDHGAAWRQANGGHVSLGQLKVMSAIESCRTAALGGHVARCEDCAHTAIAYNSCRNRHCPKCQGAAARAWLAAREAELLPVPYFHVVFTLPSAIGDIAYQNKAVIYDLLFKASPRPCSPSRPIPSIWAPRIGITAVLHTWGSALTHHPHVHMIVPGGGLSPDGSALDRLPAPASSCRCACCRKLFRRLMLEKLAAAHTSGQAAVLRRSLAHLAERRRVRRVPRAAAQDQVVRLRQAPVRRAEAVLAYLSRYTHRVAISNRRLIAADKTRRHLQLQRLPDEGPGRYKTMTLARTSSSAAS